MQASRISSPSPRTRRLARFGFIWAGMLATAYVCAWKIQHGLVGPTALRDAHAYWSVDLADPYASALTTPTNAFLYSPAIAQFFSLFQWMSWPQFFAFWTAIEGVALVLVAGPWTLLALCFPYVLLELDVANVNLLLALAIAAGFRWPATWAGLLLTKVTPAVGLLWFATRREWKKLAIALGVTAAIVGVSFAMAPNLWWDWIRAIPQSAPGPSLQPMPPLGIRLVVAAVIVVFAARTDRPWLMPVAVLLAMPVIRESMLAILVAVIPLAGIAALRAGWTRVGVQSTAGPADATSAGGTSPAVAASSGRRSTASSDISM